MREQLINFFFSQAYAATDPTSSATAQSGGSFSLLVMLAIFFGFMYFAMWRPQMKRAKEQQALLQSLTKDDEVMAAGGLLGRISKIADNYIVLTVANNVEIVVQKASVSTVFPKGTLKAIESQ